MKELMAQHFRVTPFVQVAPHPMAVEFGLSSDQPAWIAIMVSEPGGPVDRRRLHDIVHRVIG